MANNYTQFSELLKNITFVEEEWIKHRLTRPEERPPGDPWPHDDEYWPDFQWELDLDRTGESTNKHLWLYSEDSGSIDNALQFVQEFLAKFRPKEHLTLTWSST